MCPVIKCAEFIEGDVAKERVSLIVEDHRNIAGDAIVCRSDCFGKLPGLSGIMRIGSMRVVMKHINNLLGIGWIHRHGRFGEISWLRGEVEYLGLRRPWKILGKRDDTGGHEHARRAHNPCRSSS